MIFDKIRKNKDICEEILRYSSCELNHILQLFNLNK